jgi:catechol 2,3-dioxygenase-like lactoylglutathione lyase family enzyme
MVSAQGYGPEHPTGFGFGLHHVQLAMPAGEEDAARAFWVGVLGFVEIPKPPELAARGGLWVRADGVEVHLGVEGGFRAAGKAHPGIRVRGLDDLAKLLEANGVEVSWDGAFPGHRRFYAGDPFGNRLEFLEPDGTAPSW